MVRLETVVAEIRAIRGDVVELKEELSRYRGFIAGVAWCMTAVAGLIGFVWGMIFDH